MLGTSVTATISVGDLKQKLEQYPDDAEVLLFGYEKASLTVSKDGRYDVLLEEQTGHRDPDF